MCYHLHEFVNFNLLILLTSTFCVFIFISGIIKNCLQYEWKCLKDVEASNIYQLTQNEEISVVHVCLAIYLFTC